MASSSALYSLQKGGSPEILSRFISLGDGLSSVASPALSVLPWGGLMAVFSSNVYLPKLDAPQSGAVTLTISGWIPDQTAAAKALLELGNITLQEVPLPDNTSLQTNLLTGSSQEDILVLDTSSFDMESMVKKGYAQNLGENPQLASFSESLLPQLKNLSVNDSGVWAVPVSINLSMPSINYEAFQELGETPPASLNELTAFIRRYVEDIYPNSPEYKLFPFVYIKRHLKEFALSAYLDVKMADESPLSLDPKELEALLDSIDALDLESLDLPDDVDPDMESFFMIDEDPSSVILMQLNAGYRLNSSGDSHDVFLPTLLPLDGQKPYTHASAVFMAVPASSKQAEHAMRFIEAYVRHMDGGEKAMLCPYTAVPVEDPRYEQTLREKSELAELNRQLAVKAEGAEKRLYDEMADYFQNDLELLRQRGRYSITAEHLERNKAIMESVYVDSGVSLAIHDTLFSGSTLVNQLLDGALTPEQFADEVNQKAKMVFLERK